MRCLLCATSLFILLLPSSSDARAPALPKAIETWKLHSGPELIRGNKLFDYMNGAAEVHRMYGFRSLWLWRYRHGSTTLKVELFDLGSAEGAFGDFTHARDLEGQTVALGQDAHYQSGVLWFWKGRHLGCLSARTKPAPTPCPTCRALPPADLRRALEQVGRVLASKLRAAPRPTLPRSLPRAGLRKRTIRYFKAKAALSYHYSDFTSGDRLKLDGNAEAVMADYKTTAGASVLLIVSYPSSKRCKLVRERFTISGPSQRADGKWHGVWRKGPYLWVVLEAPTAKEARRLGTARSQRK